MFPLSKINSYTPIVSDVSDDDLVETVKQLENSENLIMPIPLMTRTMPFDVFKATRGHQSCSTRKSVKSPNIYVSLCLRLQNAVPAQPCVGKLGISLVLLNFLHCNFRLWFKTP